MQRGIADQITVIAPSRLHFGLAAFGDSSVAQYGGVGAMIEFPQHRLVATRERRFSVSGSGWARVREFALRWWNHKGRAGEPQVKLSVEQSVPAHVGLGTGTQVAMSVAAALECLYGDARRAREPAWLAAAVGRGKRSAIGTYGFCQGGFLVDAGKRPTESLGKLVQRETLPPDWRAVLVRPEQCEGLSGTAEQREFDQLPPVPHEVTDSLWREVYDEMIPALRAGECARFGEALYRYGVIAGNCFAPAQGGPFASQSLADAVAAIRGLGIAGVGQSSWGPTVFAVVESESQAIGLLERLREILPRVEVFTTPFCQTGASILGLAP
jgi:beta-RFAP synthase